MKLAILLVPCSACWATDTSQFSAGAHGQVMVGKDAGSGMEGGGFIGYAGAELGSEITERTVSRPGERRAGTTIDDFARLSIPGMLPTDHDLERDIDFGIDAGAGGGFTRAGGFGEAYAGGWAEVRVTPDHDGDYTALTVGARREAITSWDTQTIFMVGITKRLRDASPRWK
jgi:hypothetical protein